MTGIALNLELESCPKNIAEVEPYIAQICKEFNVADAHYGNILISLTEAVTNAIVHGNKSVTEKKVSITTSLDSKKLCFAVQDEGQGFDPAVLPDPTEPERLLETGGRGVFIIKKLADKVMFEDDGRLVLIEFAVS